MHDVLRGLLLQQDPAHLRAVAVGDDDLPPGGRDVGDALGGRARGPVHLLERVLGAAAEQGVAAEGDDDPLHPDASRPEARLSPRAPARRTSVSCGESGRTSRS